MSLAAVFILGYVVGAIVVAVLIGLTLLARRRAGRGRDGRRFW